MTSAIKLLDVVALTVDLPEYNLKRGQVGTVVELLAGGSVGVVADRRKEKSARVVSVLHSRGGERREKE